jgi:Protein of unknown function (DUF2934)
MCCISHNSPDTQEANMIKTAQTLELTGRRCGWPDDAPDPRATHPAIEAAWRQRMISEAAYFRSQKRQPCIGRELEDWLAAEKEIRESLQDF